MFYSKFLLKRGEDKGVVVIKLRVYLHRRVFFTADISAGRNVGGDKIVGSENQSGLLLLERHL